MAAEIGRHLAPIAAFPPRARCRKLRGFSQNESFSLFGLFPKIRKIPMPPPVGADWGLNWEKSLRNFLT